MSWQSLATVESGGETLVGRGEVVENFENGEVVVTCEEVILETGEV